MGNRAKQGLGDLGPSRADQPGHADDLARVDAERDAEEFALRGEIFDPQNGFRGAGARPLGAPLLAEQLALWAAHHVMHDLRLAQPLHFVGHDASAVAQDGDPVGKAGEFLQTVRDEKN